MVSDPFSTLGLPWRFDLDPARIEERWRELQKAWHPDKHVGRPPHERRIALSKAVEVNEAYRVLRDDLTRAEALLVLRGHPTCRPEPEDPEFLAGIMERREAVQKAWKAGDLARVQELAAEVRALCEKVRAEIATRFAEPDPDLRAIADQIGRWRYYRRFLEDVEAFEAEAVGGAASSTKA